MTDRLLDRVIRRIFAHRRVEELEAEVAVRDESARYWRGMYHREVRERREEQMRLAGEALREEVTRG